MWIKLLFIIMAMFFTWQLWRFLKYNPEALSEDNVKRSLPVFGWLALFLVVVIAITIWIARSYG